MNRRTNIIFHAMNKRVLRVIQAKDVKRTMHRLGFPDFDCVACFVHAGADRKPGTPFGWIVFDENPDEATVAHESSHAVRALFAGLGVRNDSETFAYHLDFLVGRIHKFIKPKKVEHGNRKLSKAARRGN